jgi:ribonuclease HII
MSETARFPYLVGIDEAGRGPLAGPVAVCAVAVERGADVEEMFPGVKDSKQMTAKARGRIYAQVLEFAKDGSVRFSVSFTDAAAIDARGISRAVRDALDACVLELALPPAETHIYLDGLLKASPEYAQETVIHGDALIPVISLASVIAKESRDALMESLAREYPGYGLEGHKGYGTASHIKAIRALGPSPIHRKSFLTRILAAV